MRTIITLAATLILAASSIAAAQDHSAHGSRAAAPSSGAAVLPPACEAAAQSGDAAATGSGTGSSDMGDASTDPVQKGNMDAMMKMHEPMLKAATIKDADLAFNCGMIAHHAGAIAMAEVELAHGKDEASKALAQRIIAAQEQEIAEMTAWVEKHTGN